MNQKFYGIPMRLLLVISGLLLSACGTLQVEQLEPAASELEQQATPAATAVLEAAATDVNEPAATAVLEEVVTETAVLLTPTVTALPPAQTIHNSNGSEVVALPGCFDFDNGGSLAPPDPNCDFNLLPGQDGGTIEIYPIAPARLAYGGVFSEAPTFAQCAGSESLSAEPEMVAPMATMYVCYRTGEDRVGYLHFTDADLEQAYTVTFEWVTFSLAQDSGANPAEMPLVYTNDSFNFTLPLPESWRDYTVTQNNYDGVTNFCFTFVGSAPICVLQIDIYSQEAWEKLENVPENYYLAENDLFVFASGPHQEACVQLDEFQCARYQEIPAILSGFLSE